MPHTNIQRTNKNNSICAIFREIHLFRRYKAHHAYATICLNCLKSLWQKKNSAKKRIDKVADREEKEDSHQNN